MEATNFGLSETGGKFKITNATNGIPCHKRNTQSQYICNFAEGNLTQEKV